MSLIFRLIAALAALAIASCSEPRALGLWYVEGRVVAYELGLQSATGAYYAHTPEGWLPVAGKPDAILPWGGVK